MTNWKNDYRHIPVNDLTLDIKNPRTDSGAISSDADLIKELLDEKVMDLAQDIVQNGYAPTSVLMAVKGSNQLTVIEGNRRLMALKIINNPEILKDISPIDFKKAKDLEKNRTEDLSSATVIVYPDRELAEKDMAKLHLAGIAIQQWKPIRQYRYFQKRIDEDQLSIDSLSELLTLKKTEIKRGVKTYQLYELAKNNLQEVIEEIGFDIFTDQNFKTDKFQRAIVHSSGERFLGYSFSETEQKIEIVDHDIFYDRLHKVLLELYDTQPRFLSGAQFKSKERDDFFRSVDGHYLTDSEFKKYKKQQEELAASGQDGLFGGSKPDPKIAPSKEVKESEKPLAPKEKGTRPKPDWVAGTDVRFYSGADRVKDILNELKKNQPTSGTNLNIVVVALRIVVELAIYHKLKEKGIITKMLDDDKARRKASNKKRVENGQQPLSAPKKNWSPSLKEMLSYMFDEANNIVTDPQERKALEKMTSSSSDFVDDLDNFVHNVSFIPSETAAKEIWKTFARPIFTILKKM